MGRGRTSGVGRGGRLPGTGEIQDREIAAIWAEGDRAHLQLLAEARALNAEAGRLTAAGRTEEAIQKLNASGELIRAAENVRRATSAAVDAAINRMFSRRG